MSAQQNISNVRKLTDGETATVSGIITNGSELGPIRYIQDATGGLAIYDPKLSNVKRGDSITVTGDVAIYNNLFELKNISSLTVHSSGNSLPEPKVLTIDQIGENYEGQLIRIDTVEFNGASGTFSGNKNYNFTDGINTGVIRINKSSPIVGQPVPSGKINLISVCSQWKGIYQLLPRKKEDIILLSPVNIISPIVVKLIAKNSFTLSWSTDVAASSQVVYGTTNTPNTWAQFAQGGTVDNNGNFYHEVEITGLNPATIIYAKAFSVLGTDTAFSSVGVYATQSNSTGEIKAYFNTQVNTNLSTGTNAKYIGRAMEDTLIAYINRATESIDFCIYNINNSGLSNVSAALNAAHNGGVKIRFITSGTTSHSGTHDLISGIPIIESPVYANSGLMHNKFVIFDANSANPVKPWVWSGSTNLTYDQINSDANNMVFIQDQSLAKAYQLEFEEMWGSTGNQPVYGNARFGAAKKDNTPHEFIIGGNRVQSYFSPSDGTNQQIINSINSADGDLNVETMVITRSDIANAISSAKTRGVVVHVLTNSESDNTATVNSILSAALPNGKFIFDNTAKATLHHKLAIIDAESPASDPQVITGSHNWSNAANNKNDENTLIIHNAEIAKQYLQQFGYRFVENGGNLMVSTEIIEIDNIEVYPNPTVGIVTVSAQNPIKNIMLFSLTGAKLKEIYSVMNLKNEVDFSGYKPGLYILKVETKDNRSNTYKVIKK
jgi:phosphatidylserine/phosphatidylglycerophosphate/cardiolipin synthase-like enzyme